MAGVLRELQRRNVIRAAILYAGGAWSLAQVIVTLGPVVGAPDWLARWFLVAAAIGFPFWIVFAWFYELTPQGIKRESEVDADKSVLQSHGPQARFPGSSACCPWRSCCCSPIAFERHNTAPCVRAYHRGKIYRRVAPGERERRRHMRSISPTGCQRLSSRRCRNSPGLRSSRALPRSSSATAKTP